MPLIQIRCDPNMIASAILTDLRHFLPPVAAEALTCKEGGPLAAGDIIIEFDNVNSLDINIKHINVRVWAHDYPSRQENLDTIRKQIAEELLKHIPPGMSWYVWVLLAPTSYGSDTEG